MFKIITNRKLSWFTDTITKLHGIIERDDRTIKKQYEVISHLITSTEQQEQIIRKQAEEIYGLKNPPYVLTVAIDTEYLINNVKIMLQETMETISTIDKTPLRDEKGRFKKKE